MYNELIEKTNGIKRGRVGHEYFSNEMRYIFGILSRDKELNREKKYDIITESSRFNKEDIKIRDINQINSVIDMYRAKDLQNNWWENKIRNKPNYW